MEAHGLARRIGGSVLQARELLDAHRRAYRQYWTWREAVIDDAVWNRKIVSAMGWPQHIRPPINTRSIANFPMQAGGADMLRQACCYATEKGAPVCATVHDALAFECDERELEDVTDTITKSMVAASRDVLDGFELRVDSKVVRYPDRYVDERGVPMWNTVMDALNGLPDRKEA
jgi:DNA polymerase I-like protein with 3'-5' exonuclease and polymerase domains